MQEELLIQFARFAACPEILSAQTKEDMILTVMILSREKLSEIKIRNKVRNIFGCSIPLEEVRQILTALCRADKLLCGSDGYSLTVETCNRIRRKSESEVIQREPLLNKWIEKVVRPQYDELDDGDIQVIKSNLNRFLNTILEKANETEEENKELKKEIYHERQKNEQLKRQLEKIKAENSGIHQQLNTYMEAAAAMKEKSRWLEEELSSFQTSNKKKLILTNTAICTLATVAISFLDAFLLSLSNFEWAKTGKLQKTIFLSSFPFLVSFVAIIVGGTSKAGKIFSAVCAGVGVIVGIYKCF